MLANFTMREDSELRSTMIEVAYPAAVIAGATVLIGLAQRTGPLLTRTGAVSVLRFCGVAGVVISACIVGLVLGRGVFPLLCWYVAFTSAVASALVLILRSGTHP